MKRLLVATLLIILLFSGHALTARELRVTEEEVYCLALNDYYEARGEPIEGRVAVAYVVVNRLREVWSGAVTICEVVSQQVKGNCAFSWACNRYPIRESTAWADSLRFAEGFLRTYRNGIDPTYGSVYYHEQSVMPYWAKEYDYTIVIGDHIFYPKQVARK